LLRNIAEDSPRNKENITQILTAFVKSYKAEERKDLPLDVDAAATVLSWLARDLITAKSINWLGILTRGFTGLRPHNCVFDATNVLSDFAVVKSITSKAVTLRWVQGKASWVDERIIPENKFLQWQGLKAKNVDMSGITLKGADLCGAHLKGVDFSNACLEGVWFWYASIKNTNMIGANLEGASFRHAKLRRNDYLFNTIKGAEFTYTDFGKKPRRNS